MSEKARRRSRLLILLPAVAVALFLLPACAGYVHEENPGKKELYARFWERCMGPQAHYQDRAALAGTWFGISLNENHVSHYGKSRILFSYEFHREYRRHWGSGNHWDQFLEDIERHPERCPPYPRENPETRRN